MLSIQARSDKRIDTLVKRIDTLVKRIDTLTSRMDALAGSVAALGERMARVEGLLEGAGVFRRAGAHEPAATAAAGD